MGEMRKKENKKFKYRFKPSILHLLMFFHIHQFQGRQSLSKMSDAIRLLNF